MASKVGQYSTRKVLISEEYLTVQGRQSEDSHRLQSSQQSNKKISQLLIYDCPRTDVLGQSNIPRKSILSA